MSMKIRLDALAAQLQAAYHCDASEANVFARELLKVRAGIFEIKFPELKALTLVPRAPGLNATDEEYTYRVATEYGTTGLAASYTGTAPRADVSMVEATPARIRPFRVAYGYDIQEARIAARTGNGLPQRKANAARKACAQEVNRVFTYGDSTKYGVAMAGLANLSGTNTYTTPVGAGGLKAWSTKTPDEIVLDMHGMVKKVVIDSNGVEVPDTMLLSLNCYEIAATTRMGDGSDTTILKHFMATTPHIKTVESWHALDSANDPASLWTGDRAIVYRKHPDVLEGILPVEFEQFAPQMIGLETVTECQTRLGGVVLYLPKAVIYADDL